VRVNQLISIKTGGCPEDCAYCSQSVHNDSGVKPKALMSTAEVVAIATRARDNGDDLRSVVPREGGGLIGGRLGWERRRSVKTAFPPW
jgi:biotin synthase-like enzyme